MKRFIVQKYSPYKSRNTIKTYNIEANYIGEAISKAMKLDRTNCGADGNQHEPSAWRAKKMEERAI